MRKKIEIEEDISVIYILSTPHDSLLKVGITTKTAKQRAKQLEQQTASVGKFSELWSYKIPTELSKIIEKQVHLILTKNNTHHKKEYFNASLQECIDAINFVVTEVDVESKIKNIRIRNKQANIDKWEEIYKEIKEEDELISNLFNSVNQELIIKITNWKKIFYKLNNEKREIEKSLNFFQYIFSKEISKINKQIIEMKESLIELDRDYNEAKNIFCKAHRLRYVHFHNCCPVVIEFDTSLWSIKKQLKITQDHWRMKMK